MGGLNWIETLSAILFVAVCAMAGTLWLMQQMESIVRAERAYGLPEGNTSLVGGVIGGLAGFGIAFIGIYYYLFADPGGGFVVWVGRSSYVLILAASAAHLSVMIHLWMRLDREERALSSEKAPAGTLTVRRQQGLDRLGQSRGSYADVRARDEEALEEWVSVFGERLLTGQRALSRIPFYGYLGTVCGILLMADHLTQLDEATETFLVLRNMAGGLVLAFQTTLVALLAYLPLRKGFDMLLNRMADVERGWLSMRDGV